MFSSTSYFLLYMFHNHTNSEKICFVFDQNKSNSGNFWENKRRPPACLVFRLWQRMRASPINVTINCKIIPIGVCHYVTWNGSQNGQTAFNLCGFFRLLTSRRVTARHVTARHVSFFFLFVSIVTSIRISL